jgi:DNA-3-methyladenine glycosylase
LATEAGAEAAAIAPLPRSFYERPTAVVARELLGKVMVRRQSGRLLSARIVEVEAYLGPKDAASHTRRGPTPRTAIMFGPPGHLYVYLIYGMHHCMNFVTEPEGTAGAVLIRAAEPLAGFAPGGPTSRPILSGPGKVCAGMSISLRDKGLDLTRADLFYVADDGSRHPRRAVSPRIGVAYAGPWSDRKLRYYVPGNPHVSGRPR